MSQKLVSHNADLSRLRSIGLDVSVSGSNQLLVRNVPYVNSAKEIRLGIIASVLDLAGGKTVPPESHVVFFVGEYPCDEHGKPLPGVSANTNHPLGEGMVPNHQISRKPTAGPHPGKYADYFEKIKTYIAIICSPAQAIDPAVSPYTHPVFKPDPEDASAFNYIDTGETKAGILAANQKLEGRKIAIIGVGGTGCYILDFVAKTPVGEIHIFDFDMFLNHNAFRCPGAPSLSELEQKKQKVTYLTEIYSRMRKKIIPHDVRVDDSSVDQLRGMDFVFICIDKGSAKRLIVERLEEWGVSFIDVGMGIQLRDDNKLAGKITVTTSTPQERGQFRERVAFSDGAAANEYSTSISISELNALNAALAVIKWKKHWNYYEDDQGENWCIYTIGWNRLKSEDAHEG